MSLRVALINPILSPDVEMPLGLLYVADAAARAGHQVEVLDTAFARSAAHLWPALERLRPDVVGFTAMSLTYPNALAQAREVKRRLGASCRTVLGGPHATLFPRESVEEGFDAAVMGDGELSFPRLLQAIEAGRTGAVAGVCHRLGREVAIDEAIPRVEDLDALPFPDRTRLDTLPAYIALMGHHYLFGHRALSVATSRGCPFDCSFCQPVLRRIHGKKVRVRSAQNVVSELSHLKRLHGIDAIWFVDDTFTFDARWVEELCQRMIDSRLGLHWSCNSRVDTVSEELLRRMADAGCVQVRFGLESGSQLLLDRTMKKGISVEQSVKAFAWARGCGIRTWAYTMVGGLDESRETVQQTEQLLGRIKPHHIQITMITPLPGTAFAQTLSSAPGVRVLPHGFGDLKMFERCLVDTPLLGHREVESLQRRLYIDHPGFDPSRLSGRERARWALRRLDHAVALRRLHLRHPALEPQVRPLRQVLGVAFAALSALPVADRLRLWTRRTLLRGKELARDIGSAGARAG